MNHTTTRANPTKKAGSAPFVGSLPSDLELDNFVSVGSPMFGDWLSIGSFPSQDMVAIERKGVPGDVIKDLAEKLSLTTVRFAQIIGVPKATLERKAANRTLITGGSAYAALGTIKLVNTVQAMLNDSTHPDAKKTDAARWLGLWIEQPQLALGGQKPADLMDTPTGMAMVSRVLGAIASGAYL